MPTSEDTDWMFYIRHLFIFCATIRMEAKENNRGTLLGGRAQVLGLPAGAAAAALAYITSSSNPVLDLFHRRLSLSSRLSYNKRRFFCVLLDHTETTTIPFFLFFSFFLSKPALGPVLFFSRTIQIPISITTTPTTDG